jgi:CRISPR system Cascade subunit CasD
MATLIMRLEGPLQAWGVDGAHSVRRTHLSPQKRGVLGLIRAARGLPKQEAWTGLDQLQFDVRVYKRPRRMWDFATMHQIIRADGKSHLAQGVQEKEYLMDGGFLVGLTGELALLETIKVFLCNPVFMPSLGRADCSPSFPIFWSLSTVSAHVAFAEADQVV